jgi:hypothetical protein
MLMGVFSGKSGPVIISLTSGSGIPGMPGFQGRKLDGFTLTKVLMIIAGG